VATAAGDDEAISRTVASTLAFFAIVGAVLAVIVIALSGPLTDLFSVSGDLRGPARAAFALVGGQLVFEMSSRALAAVLEGTQQFVTYQAVELTKAIVFAASTVAVLLSGGGIGLLGVAYAGTSALSLLVYWVLAHRAVAHLHAAPTRATWPELRRLLRYGTSVFTLRVTGTIYRQMDKLILGIATTPKLVAIYEVANKIHLSASVVQSISVSALVPAAAQSRRDPWVLRDMYLRGTCYTVAASLPFTVGAIVFAHVLIRDWIGPDALGATHAAQLFLVYLSFMVFHNAGTTMLVGLGRIRLLMVITVTMTIVNLAASILLVGPLDVEGVILGTLIASALGWGPLLVLMLREFDVGFGQWVRRIALPQLPGTLVQVALALALVTAVDSLDSLIADGAALVLTVIASLVAFVGLGVRGFERTVLIATVRRALARGDDDSSAPPPAPTPPTETDLAAL
jgi:O-antigen/teichoic acid export membrane protein